MPDWTPAFPGQRPPFEPGNELSTTHGANSPRKVAPLAAEIERAARTDPSWPGYLNDPGYGLAVASWARAEAVCRLLFDWLAEQDPAEWMASTLDSVTDTEKYDGGSQSRTRARRVGSVMEQLRAWESTAAKQRQRLGLDPLSRARLGRDVTAGAVDFVELLSRAHEAHEAERGGSGVDR